MNHSKQLLPYLDIVECSPHQVETLPGTSSINLLTINLWNRNTIYYISEQSVHKINEAKHQPLEIIYNSSISEN